jgi:phosphoribosylglycinamide formyltransferase-1
MPRRRVAVLISGRGSNMSALVAAAEAPDYPAEIVLVVSNRADAAGLADAARAGIVTACVEHAAHPDREGFDAALDAVLAAHRVELVCLAGFMRVLTDAFVERWAGRIINIHPSLLPLFRGTKTHRRALEAGVRIHGCTVHFVVPELDAGPIVSQAAVPVRPGDTEETLAARVLAQEHRLYRAALRMICAGEASLEGGRVTFRDARTVEVALLSPDDGPAGAMQPHAAADVR